MRCAMDLRWKEELMLIETLFELGWRVLEDPNISWSALCSLWAAKTTWESPRRSTAESCSSCSWRCFWSFCCRCGLAFEVSILGLGKKYEHSTAISKKSERPLMTFKTVSKVTSEKYKQFKKNSAASASAFDNTKKTCQCSSWTHEAGWCLVCHCGGLQLLPAPHLLLIWQAGPVVFLCLRVSQFQPWLCFCAWSFMISALEGFNWDGIGKGLFQWSFPHVFVLRFIKTTCWVLSWLRLTFS